MQTTSLQTTTTNDLDKICNDFLWGEKEGKKKLHLVSKDITFCPKEQGGLGSTPLEIIRLSTSKQWLN